MIVLAAGGSTRMGVPKQLLPWGRTTLLRHACETAVRAGLGPVVVVLGRESAACEQECANLTLTTVTNPAWTAGLGSSIAVGVRQLLANSPEVSGALIMLADQPGVTAEWLKELAQHWKPPAWPIVATSYDSAGGVPAIFDGEFFPDLLRLPPREGARLLLRREHHRTQRLTPERAFLDLDTPDDYRSAQPPPIKPHQSPTGS